MNKKYINIKFMTDEAIALLKKNLGKVAELMKTHPTDNSWINDILKPLNGKIYVEKAYRIVDFDLKKSNDGNYKNVDFENSVKLYENLNKLPNHILTDERFWAWLNFEKFYSVALKAIHVKDEGTVKRHYFFAGGNRRGIFFGVLSRCYYRVAFTIDDIAEDKYELTRFVIEKPERFRNLSWRTYSSQKNIVMSVLKAEKDIFEKYGEHPSLDIYPEVAKFISKFGSVRWIDTISDEEIYDRVYKKMEEIISATLMEI